MNKMKKSELSKEMPERSDNWYALYTKGRHEKSVKAELEKRCIESFLPTRKIKKHWSDRTVTTEEPLFKSYLFVKTDYSHKNDVLKARGAVAFISADKKPIPVAEDVIFSLKNIIQQEINMDPFPYLEKGDRVCVKSGPFKGTEGFVSRKDGKKCRIIISVSAIRCSISVEVDSCLVEKT